MINICRDILTKESVTMNFRKYLSVTMISLVYLCLAVSALAQGQPPRQPTPNDTLISPEVHSDKRVTFRIYAPKSAEVMLRGDWMEGPAPVQLQKDEKGVWSATVGPLAPDFYS